MENKLDKSIVARSDSFEDLVKLVLKEQNYLISSLIIDIDGIGKFPINDQDQYNTAKSYIDSDYQTEFSFECNFQAESTENLDFFITSELGIPQCSTIKIGETISKDWEISASNFLDSILIVCTEGEFKGLAFEGTHLGQTNYKLSVKILAQGTKRWSSSYWKAYCKGYFFGPLLWLEVYIE